MGLSFSFGSQKALSTGGEKQCSMYLTDLHPSGVNKNSNLKFSLFIYLFFILICCFHSNHTEGSMLIPCFHQVPEWLANGLTVRTSLFLPLSFIFFSGLQPNEYQGISKITKLVIIYLHFRLHKPLSVCYCWHFPRKGTGRLRGVGGTWTLALILLS